jgi:transcriptional regulator with XRE-family HTH domain
MGEVIRFQRKARHVRAPYKSGRKSRGSMPVNSEIGRTRSAGIRPTSQRRAVDLLTPNTAANASNVIPVLARNKRIGRVSMRTWLHNTQLGVKTKVAFPANDRARGLAVKLRMPRTAKIHASKQPKRLHYIQEWMELRQLEPKDITEHLGVDKSTVSRWLAGTVPTNTHLYGLADLFALDEPSDLFRDPADDWMTDLLRGRSKDELRRIRKMIDLAFPKNSKKSVA